MFDNQKIDSLVNTEGSIDLFHNKKKRRSTSREGFAYEVKGRFGVLGKENTHDVSTA